MSSYFQVDFGATNSRFNPLQPRSYVLASNVEALVLKTALPETRLTFLNSSSKFIAFTSNSDFVLSQTATSNAILRASGDLNAGPRVTVMGTTVTSNLAFSSTGNKQILLTQYSDEQFAGFGYTGDTLFYQTPAPLSRHIFRANAANLNEELLRIQSTSTGPQMGIGLTGATRTIESDTTFKVVGTTRIQGDLVLSGNLTMTNPASNFLKTDQKIPLSLLPSNIVYTKQDNKIDDSLLTAGFNFQFLKSQKNVGIGTRIPMQKFHVQGSVAVSDRLGVGTTQPSSRIHAVENSASICTATFENGAGGNIIEAYGSNSAPVLVVRGDRQSIGIGTSTFDMYKTLTVAGDATITNELNVNSLIASNVTTNYLNIVGNNSAPVVRVLDMQDGQGNNVKSFNVYSSLMARSSLSTDTIQPFSSTVVKFDSNIRVTGVAELERFPLVQADSNAMRSKNVLPSLDALQKITSLTGYMCNWKTGDTSPTLVAQEVANVFPEAVRTMSDGTQAIMYEAFIPLIIQAMKQLVSP